MKFAIKIGHHGEISFEGTPSQVARKASRIAKAADGSWNRGGYVVPERTTVYSHGDNKKLLTCVPSFWSKKTRTRTYAKCTITPAFKKLLRR